MANEQAKKANLSLSRARGSRDAASAASRSFSPRDALALGRARSRNDRVGLSKNIQGKVGAQVGRVAGGAVGSAIPVLGTTAGAAVGGFLGKRFGRAPLWQKIAILATTTFISFLPLLLVLFIILVIIIILGETFGLGIGFSL